MSWLFDFLSLAAASTAVPSAVLLLEATAACFARSRPAHSVDLKLPTVVLIPAHDEAEGIAATLERLTTQIGSNTRILVVADNCQDDTANEARRCGADVIERHDQSRVGKGYALEFGIRHLESSPPRAVVFLDADCSIDPGGVEYLAGICCQAASPVQALYLMRSGSEPAPGQEVAAFAWRLKNWVRPLGLSTLHQPCHLQGSGMAFPFGTIRVAPLASGKIVEDLQLGIDLACQGKFTLFCPEVTVVSDFPRSKGALASQRERWEHGHLSTILVGVAKLLRAAISQRDWRPVSLALDLVVPPLALLLSLTAGTCAVTLIWSGSGHSAVPMIVALAGFLALFTSVSIAWHGWGREVLSVGSLVYIPLYVLGKLPMYAKFFTRRQKSWVRTRRD